MQVTYSNGIYSLDRCDFTIDGIDYLITGTHRVEDVYGHRYMVEFKNIETKEQFTVRHHNLCEKILKYQEDENNSKLRNPPSAETTRSAPNQCRIDY